MKKGIKKLRGYVVFEMYEYFRLLNDLLVKG